MPKEQSTEVEPNISVIFRTSPTLDKLIEVHAAQTGISKSEAINRALRAYFVEEKRGKRR